MINFIVCCWKFGPKNLQVNLPNRYFGAYFQFMVLVNNNSLCAASVNAYTTIRAHSWGVLQTLHCVNPANYVLRQIKHVALELLSVRWNAFV